MIKHFLKRGEHWTMGDFPMEENGIKTMASEVTDDEYQKILEGTRDFDIVNGRVVFIDSDRKQKMDEIKEQEAAQAADLEVLRAKLANGEASPEEVQTALSKLI